jgi:HK97 family phage prohead protease
MTVELLRIGLGGVVPVQWEVEKSGDSGTLTGWASVYNVVDQQDDVVVPGAFRKTLNEWNQSRRVIPLTKDHQNTAEGVIGSLAKAEDSAYGLKTTFSFSSDPAAQAIRDKARGGHLNGLSIWGAIHQKAMDTVAGKSIRLLKEVGLSFVGLTPMPANIDALVLTAKSASDKPWDQFTEADYTPEQWARACILDTGEGSTTVKSRYKLPVREPDGTVNRGGVQAAVSAMSGARGASLNATTEQMMAAAKKLVGVYKTDMGEDPPAMLAKMAGVASAALVLPEGWVTDMRSALGISVPQARDAAVELLVKAQYGTTVAEPGDDDQGDDTEASADTGSDENAAAKYALNIIGESEPGESPLGGEPGIDPLDGLFASLDATKTKSELEALEAELKEASGS